MLREGLKLARKIGQTAPLNNSIVEELSPGPGVQTDDDWDNWLRANVGTEYHPSCTCAMLPLDQGGVVNPNLLVYGTCKHTLLRFSLKLQPTDAFNL
jgi:choline dehydrogenase